VPTDLHIVRAGKAYEGIGAAKVEWLGIAVWPGMNQRELHFVFGFELAELRTENTHKGGLTEKTRMHCGADQQASCRGCLAKRGRRVVARGRTGGFVGGQQHERACEYHEEKRNGHYGGLHRL